MLGSRSPRKSSSLHCPASVTSVVAVRTVIQSVKTGRVTRGSNRSFIGVCIGIKIGNLRAVGIDFENRVYHRCKLRLCSSFNLLIQLPSMLNVSERPLSTGFPMPSKRLLGAWLGPTLGWTEGKVQVKQRGNVLHILCESVTVPDRTVLTQRIKEGLAESGFLPQLTPDGALVHRLVLYGRVTGEAKPIWGETFELGMEAREDWTTGQDKPDHPAKPAALKPTLTHVNLDPIANEGIAHQLSRQLSQHNVAVRVKRRPLNDRLHRLFVVCESVYSPDPNVIAEPIAQCLRELALRDCKDALISGQVKGETEPDWLVRVDLTPADQMLRSRAQWGDMQAMERLLTPLLKPYCQSVTVSMEQTTMHVVCGHDGNASRNGNRQVIPQQVIPQTVVVKALSDFLNEVAPQGIKGASLYGVLKDAQQETTQWVHWLDLPAAQQIELASSTEDLVRRGNLTAIGQFLTLHFNPDISQQLATGGIRVQVRQKESVLHIMTDALKIPPKDLLLQAVKKALIPLGLEGITGLCVYGRRAGQMQPSWQQGIAVVPGVNDRRTSQQRLVPESVPEFTASDSYVEDLLSPPGEIVFVPRKVDRKWGEKVEKLRDGARSMLLSTPFFTPVSVNQRMVTRSATDGMDGRVAVVWGLLGLSLLVTGDWAIGLILRAQNLGEVAQNESTTQTNEPSLSSIALNRSGSESDVNAFNASEFTPNKPIKNSTKPSPNTAKLSTKSLPTIKPNAMVIDPGLDANLPSSPLQPKAAIDIARSPYPKLNSPQLDERLALYQQYVSVYGVPDVLVIGSSRALRGVDPSALQETLTQQGFGGKRVFNFGVNGATAQVVDLVLRRLIAPEQLPKMILWADGARAFNSGRTDVTYNAIAASPGFRKLPPQPIGSKPKDNSKDSSKASAPEPPPQSLADRYRTLDESLQSWVNRFSAGGQNRESIVSLAREKLLGNPIAKPKSDDETNIALDEGMTDINGFLSLSNQFNPATYYQKYSRVSGAFDGDYDSFQLEGRQQESLKAIATFTQEQKIALVFVNLPMTMEYLDPRRSEYEDEFQRSMLQMGSDLKFTYRDLGRSLDQQNALFSDPSHLNRYGAYVVSQRLAKDNLIPWKKK